MICNKRGLFILHPLFYSYSLLVIEAAGHFLRFICFSPVDLYPFISHMPQTVIRSRNLYLVFMIESYYFSITVLPPLAVAAAFLLKVDFDFLILNGPAVL